MDLSRDGEALMLRLMEGGIRMQAPCDDEKPVWVKGGADDKVFRVEKTNAAQCAALEKSELAD